MLSIGIEGDRRVGLVLTGDLEAGVEDGTFTLVMLVLDDNHPGGLGDLSSEIGGTVIDDDQLAAGPQFGCHGGETPLQVATASAGHDDSTCG